MKVLVVHNIPAPYRVQQFAELTRYFDVEVLFVDERKRGRHWEHDTTLPFSWSILGGFHAAGTKISAELLTRDVSGYDALLIVDSGWDVTPTVLMLLRTARKHRIPIVTLATQIDTEWDRRFSSNRFALKRNLAVAYRRHLYKYTDTFVANSGLSRDLLMRRGIDCERIYLGQVSLDYEREAHHAVATPDKGDFVVVGISYLRENKGFQYLIEAFRQLDIDGARLVIAGSGEYEDQLKELARGASNIEFPGFKTGADKLELLLGASVFVLPTLHDPWGLVVNEAMTVGLPIITTSAAGSSEMINGNGYVVPPADVPQLAEALYGLGQQPVLRKEMGQKSLDIIPQYSIECTTVRLAEAIRATVETPRGR